MRSILALTVCLTCILTATTSAFAADTQWYPTTAYGPSEKKNFSPDRFKYSKEKAKQKMDFQAGLTKDKTSDDSDKMIGGLSLGYGQLFTPLHSGHRYFGFISGKSNTNNLIRLNTSMGGFFPWLEGEWLLSHRLLGKRVNASFDHLGETGQQIFENSFSTSYTRYLTSYIRELSLSYQYSLLPGQEFSSGSTVTEDVSSLTSTHYFGGYGDTTTNTLGAGIVLGCEELDWDYLNGLKIDLGIGYEHTSYDAFYSYDEEQNEGISGIAAFQQQTALGLLKSSYKLSPSANTFYAGYLLGHVELYIKDVDYLEGTDSQSVGINLKFDLSSFPDIFKNSAQALFSQSSTSYKGTNKIRHSSDLDSDDLTAYPKLREAGVKKYASSTY